MAEPLLAVDDLVVHFAGGRGLLHRTEPFAALGGVSFTVEPGRAYALVGESGVGKSTVARCVAGLLPGAAARPAAAIVHGTPYDKDDKPPQDISRFVDHGYVVVR